MKLYFYSNSQPAVIKDIKAYLKKLGLEIVTEEADNKKSALTLADINFLLIHDLPLDNRSSYLLALALAQNKDVVCLMPDSKKNDQTLETFLQNKNLAKKLHIASYNSQNLAASIDTVLAKFNLDKLNEVVNIKYTLRISNKINNYLNWKAEQVNMPKADWLRAEIHRLMAEDKSYQDKQK